MSICYSLDEDDYSPESIEDAVERAVDDGAEIGDEIVIYTGEATIYPASHYLPTDLPEQMVEAAYEWVDFRVEGWLSTREKAAALTAVINSAVDKWATETDNHPKFAEVKCTGHMVVKIKSEDGDYEVVTK